MVLVKLLRVKVSVVTCTLFGHRLTEPATLDLAGDPDSNASRLRHWCHQKEFAASANQRARHKTKHWPSLGQRIDPNPGGA
jgi:hypothetical protein